MTKTILSVLIVLMSLSVKAQTPKEFKYTIDGLNTMIIQTDLPEMSKEDIYEGFKYFVLNNFSEPLKMIHPPQILENEIIWQMSWPTGVVYYEMGLVEQTGNIIVEAVLTAYDGCYTFALKSVVFETADARSNAIRKNSEFYKLEARAKFIGKEREAKLDDYLNLTNTKIKEFILKSK